MPATIRSHSNEKPNTPTKPKFTYEYITQTNAHTRIQTDLIATYNQQKAKNVTNRLVHEN